LVSGATYDEIASVESVKYRKLIHEYSFRYHFKLKMRSVERDICPIATSTINELFL